VALNPSPSLKEINSLLASNEGAIKEFMRQICAIPSVDGQITEVAGRIEQELLRLGYDDVHYDDMGCLLGRLGEGSKKLLYDAHLDTVGIGEISDWAWDPFGGRL
jgi:acetylornithine deacetylase/succinyl-diaminopimelate desuccinylase-like protein